MRKTGFWVAAVLALVGGAFAGKEALVHLGKQPDGSFIVSTGQHIVAGTIAFKGRPSDLALHPKGNVFAVLNQGSVFLCTETGVVPNSEVSLGASAGFHGLVWSPDGSRLFASTEKGQVQTFTYDGTKLTLGPVIHLTDDDEKNNPVSGGMCFGRGGKTLFVTAANLNAVIAVDTTTNKPTKSYAVGSLPYDVKVAGGGRTLVVSNWGGKIPAATDTSALSLHTPIVTDSRGAPASGTVSFIDLPSGNVSSTEVGIHPSAIVAEEGLAYIANGMSDEISIIAPKTQSLIHTIPLSWHDLKIVGAMPDAMAISGGKLYVADGGDNALCQINLASGEIEGFRPAGYFPIALAIHNGKAIVLNSKGNGSVARTAHGGKFGNAHDFEGTVSVIDLSTDIAAATKTVAPQQPLGLAEHQAEARGLQRRDQARALHHQGESDLRRDLRRYAGGQRRPEALCTSARRSCRTTARSPASSRCLTTAT